MQKGKIGILLINLGTPEATDFWSMRRYLREFLSDKRVIEAKGPVWWLVFNGIILTRKPRSSGKAYAKIWNRERDESPLKTITRSQAEKLASGYQANPEIEVDWAMRYGKPSIAQGMESLADKGCDRLLLFPLYPQYSAATTASAMDRVFDTLKTMRHQPTLRMVPPYYDHPAYIDAITTSLRDHLARLAWQPDAIIASLHGLPQAFIDKGDPYQQQCEATVAQLCKTLGKDILLTYQSRSGRAVWIGPDTEETLVELARAGQKNVVIIAPGFAADCVETLEELQIRAAKAFVENGGKNFSMVPALNDSETSLSLLRNLADQQLCNWA